MSEEIPHDFEAEQAILGTAIYDNSLLMVILSIIKKPNYFYTPAHQFIFRSMIEMLDQNKPIDEILLGDELKSLNQLEVIGGYSYLFSLNDCVPSSGNIEYYSKIVAEKSHLRQLISLTTETSKKSRDPEFKAASLIDDTIEDLLTLRTGLSNSARAVEVFDCLPGIINNIESVRDNKTEIGLVSGYSDFDRMLGGGAQKGDLIFIGAEPSVGKTSLGICLSYALIDKNKKGLIISIESSKESIIRDRLLPAILHVNSHKLRRGDMSQDKWDDLYKLATDKIFKNLKICDDSTITINDIYTMANMERKTKGIDFMLVDYTQLMTPTKSSGNRNNDLGDVGTGFKKITKDFNIPVIALSQLNEKEKLRDSGELNQVADVVIILKRSEDQDNIVNCEFRKNRNGIIGSIPLEFIPEYTKFLPVK